MATVEVPAKKSIMREIVEDKERFAKSRSRPTTEEYNEFKERASEKVENLVKGLTRDVNKYWFSEKHSTKSIASEWVVEAAEQMGQFLKEDRKKGTDRTRDIGDELADTLYFLVKYTDAKKIDIKKEWREGFVDTTAIGRFPSENISRTIFLFADEIYRIEFDINPDPRRLNYSESGFWKGREGRLVAGTLYLILKEAEKRNIDLEKAWQQKMKSSAKKHTKEYDLS